MGNGEKQKWAQKWEQVLAKFAPNCWEQTRPEGRPLCTGVAVSPFGAPFGVRERLSAGDCVRERLCAGKCVHRGAGWGWRPAEWAPPRQSLGFRSLACERSATLERRRRESAARSWALARRLARLVRKWSWNCNWKRKRKWRRKWRWKWAPKWSEKGRGAKVGESRMTSRTGIKENDSPGRHETGGEQRAASSKQREGGSSLARARQSN